MFVPAGSSSLLSTARAASKSDFSHQSGNPLLARAAHSQSSKLGMDPRIAIDLAASVMDLPDLPGERCVFPVSLGGRAILPVIVAAPRDPEYPAQ
jgi:hypothetical protein